MAISQVGVVTLATATSTGWPCALPAGVQDNDVAFVFLAKVDSVAPTPPAGEGYALLDPVDTSSALIYLWCYAAVLSAADASTTHTWAWGSTRAGATCVLLRGVNPATLLDVSNPNTGTAANAASLNCPSASGIVTPGIWALWATAHAADVTHTFGATFGGSVVTRVAGDVAGAIGAAWAEYPGAGGGSLSFAPVTFSASGRCIGKTLVPKPLVSATYTRFYFTNTTHPESITPSATQWARSIAAAATKKTYPTKQNTALTDYASLFGSTASSNTHWMSFLTPPLTADFAFQTSHSFWTVIRGLEGATSEDCLPLFLLRVVTPAGAERGVLVVQNLVEVTTTAQTRALTPAALAAVAAVRGDRLCLEVGFQGITPTNTSPVTLRFGNPSATADFALASGLTTDLCPWWEISALPSFAGTDYLPAGSAVQRWDGSAWQTATVQRWSGSAWTTATVKRWDGTGWV